MNRKYFLYAFFSAFVVLLLIVNYCNNLFTHKVFWVANESNNVIQIELITKKPLKSSDITSIFGFYQITDCSDKSIGLTTLEEGNKQVVDLEPKKCLQIGLCESSKENIEDILAEYRHNLEKINIYVDSEIRAINPKDLSEKFKKDGDNFYIVIGDNNKD